VAVVQYPSLTRSTVRHVELLSMSPARVMLVLITDTGRVEQRMIDCPAPFGETSVADLRARLNSRISGRRFADVPQLVQDLPDSFEQEDRGTVAVVLSTLLETVVEETEERLMIGGTANLARYGQDFPLMIRPVLEAL
ncbi:heat-inducible transcriptional repressor HrcA, partial [Streptomyces sp. SID11233]|nr:heat-inducible transcriptional repressor HrcA [Streptomyces sp. SID11233]